MILSQAPLRISLGGGGTDLPSYASEFGGFVLSVSIDKYVYICLNRPAADNLIRVKYSRYEQVATVDEIQHDLVRPAMQLLGVESNLEIVSISDVPDGTGMGSSGSYLVALLTAMYEMKRERVPREAIAEQACHIEMNLARHSVGKHDHYMAAFGGFTCLDIHRDGKVVVTPLHMSLSTVEELRSSLLLFYTGISRSSRGILKSQEEDTLSANPDVLDSLHRTKEIGYRAKECLEAGRVDEFGILLDEHWQNKKRRSTSISNGKIDRWYETAKSHGSLGGKVIGAGGGGFLLLYCPGHAKPAVREALTTEGLSEMPFDFDFAGAKTTMNK